MSEEKVPNIRVYVANLGKYNEGELVGEWLDLPKPKDEIDRFLTEVVGLELDPEVAFEKGMRGEDVYEEYTIDDYAIYSRAEQLDLKIDRYDNLETINNIAYLLEEVSDDAIGAIKTYIDQINPLEPIELASMLTNFYYNCNNSLPEGVGCFKDYLKPNKSIKEAYGEYWLNEVEFRLATILQEYEVMDFFDYEAYGESLSENDYLGDGYVIWDATELESWIGNMDKEDIQGAVDLIVDVRQSIQAESLGDKIKTITTVINESSKDLNVERKEPCAPER